MAGLAAANGWRMPAGIALLLAALLAMLEAAPAGAVDLHKSQLTSIDLKQCRQISRHRDGGAWICPGIKGWPVYIAEGDLRQMMAFGPRPERRRSATQSLATFNSVFQGRRRPTVEWRLEQDQGRRLVPYATIVRYHTSRDGAKGEALVVTKVDATDSCRMAVIDARANPDAMAIARAWAIAEVRKRPCPDEPLVLGTVGTGPM